jgi:asparagine synthase (glutamine-hydrolysing)
VRRQLIADVPVGILLSGGLDSSLITAMAARVSSNPVKTYTIFFPGYEKFDESPFARVVAEHFGSDHTVLPADSTTVELLPEMARQYDEPIADSSMIPTYLVTRLVRQHVTVALGGDGGDELFGGYPHYSWVINLELARCFIPFYLRRWTSRLAQIYLPIGFRGRNHIIGFGGDSSLSIAHINLFFDRKVRRKLVFPLSGDDSNKSCPEEYRAGLSSQAYPLLRQMVEADFRSTLTDAYLVKVDRASMLNSLEVRAPFLDYRLVEFAFGCVPDHLKATRKEIKILPRRLASKYLPTTLNLNRKHGLTMPLADWFKNEWGAYMEAVLNEIDPVFFNRNIIKQLIEEQRQGYANTQRLFALTIFELWRREYNVSLF